MKNTTPQRTETNIADSLTVSINDLQLWDRNPRSIKGDRFNELKARLKRQGQIKPLLVAADGQTVIGGNMRLRAMQELGIQEVWISQTEAVTDKEIFDLALTDNEEFGYYEQEQVAELALELGLSPLELKSYALSLGAPTTLDLVVDKFGPEVEEDEVPEVDATETISVLGEVYQLGSHRLMCGSATEFGDVEQLMNNDLADLVLTDPPYNIASDSSNFAADVSKSMNDLKNAAWDKDFDVTDFLQCMYAAIKPNSTAYVFTSHFLFGELNELLKQNYDFVNFCVWSKPNPMPSLSMRHWTFNTELCLYATKGKHTFNFPKGQNLLSTWTVTKKSDGTHPTQKPLELLQPILKASSLPGYIVLDLFGGSGSTLIACEQTNRICYMMELDPKYCDVIRKRYAKHIGEEESWQISTPVLNQLVEA